MLGVLDRTMLTERATAAPIPYKPGDIAQTPPKRLKRGFWFTVIPRASEPSCLNDMLEPVRKCELLALLDAVHLQSQTAQGGYQDVPKIQVFLEEICTPDYSKTLAYRFLFLCDAENEHDDVLIDMIRRNFNICPTQGNECKNYAAVRERLPPNLQHLNFTTPWFSALRARGKTWTASDQGLFLGCEPVVYCHGLSSDMLYGYLEFKHPYFGTDIPLYEEYRQHEIRLYHDPSLRKSPNWRFPYPELVQVIPSACCNANLLKFPLIPYRNRSMMVAITNAVQNQVEIYPTDQQSREHITRLALYHMFTQSDMFIYDAVNLFLPSPLLQLPNHTSHNQLAQLYSQLQHLPRWKAMLVRANKANQFLTLDWIGVVGTMSRSGMGTNSQIRSAQELARLGKNIILPAIQANDAFTPAGQFYIDLYAGLCVTPDARPDWYLYGRGASLTGFFLASQVMIGDGTTHVMNMAFVGETGSGKSVNLSRLEKSMCPWQVHVIDSRTARATVYEDPKGFESKHTLVVNHEGTLIHESKTSSTDKNAKTSEYSTHDITMRRPGAHTGKMSDYMTIKKRIFNGSSSAIACNPDLTEINKGGRAQDKAAQLDRLKMITINREADMALRTLRGKPGLPHDFMIKQQHISMVIQTIADQINTKIFSVRPWVTCICVHKAEWYDQFQKLLTTPEGLNIAAPKGRALQSTNYLTLMLGIWRVVTRMLGPRSESDTTPLPPAEELVQLRGIHLAHAKQHAHTLVERVSKGLLVMEEYIDLDDDDTAELDADWTAYTHHYNTYLSLLKMRHPEVPLNTEDIMALFADNAGFAIEDLVMATNASLGQFASDNLQEVARILVAFMISKKARLDLLQAHTTGYGRKELTDNTQGMWREDPKLKTVQEVAEATVNNPNMIRPHSNGLYATTERHFQPVKAGLSYGDRIVIPVNSTRVDHKKLPERNLQAQKILIEALQTSELGLKYGTNERNYLEAFCEFELIGGKIVFEQAGLLSEYLCMGMDFHLLVRLAILPELSAKVFQGMIPHTKPVPLPHYTSAGVQGSLQNNESFEHIRVPDPRRFEYRMYDLETLMTTIRAEQALGEQPLPDLDRPGNITYPRMSNIAREMSKLGFV